jgi:YYY domain-containing protein
MFSFLLWYLTLSLLGLLTFPLAYRLLPALSDRGYAISRALGLLLWGFGFWLAASLGLIRNEIGGLLLALTLVGGLSVWALTTLSGAESREQFSAGLAELRAWFTSQRALVVSVEILFLVAFACMAFVRANNPENIGTEKPMELAFINAILRSPTFPPHDPWLAGYAISYYYFGYVLTAMLALFTATSGGVAFNLMLALVFALSAVGALGLVYNLLAAYWKTRPGAGQSVVLAALLAPLFLLVLSNVEGLLEFLHARGLGWSGQPGETNGWTALGRLVRPDLAAFNFWTWLDIKDLRDAPVLDGAQRFWFWWRASRVVQDYDLRGSFVEVIDEFPFFSYLLGDLHPHVLAMPFGLLAAALALNLYLGGWRGEIDLKFFRIPLRLEGFLTLALALGGLAFLNTWDFPIYLALAAGALLLARRERRGWGWDLLEDVLAFILPLGLASIVLYLPFYVTFASQAGGILPNVIFPSRGAHLWVMFGTLWLPLFGFILLRRGNPAAAAPNWKIGFILAAGFALLLGLFSLLLTVFAAQTDLGQALISAQGYLSLGAVLKDALARRVYFSGGLLTLLALIGAALAHLTASRPGPAAESLPAQQDAPAPNPLAFVWMLILFGGLLVLGPEFVYLRDQFGSRMNTVFKFYYQAWALWSLAAAFGLALLLNELRGLRLAAAGVLTGVVLLVGLAYPFGSLPVKTNSFNRAAPQARTLDAAAYLQSSAPDDALAIQYLQTLPVGVVAEAVGGSYSEFARMATYSGLPNVLGWPGHEGQWRGGYTEQGSRQEDIRTLYQTMDWDTARAILAKYGIRYVVVGGLERTTYQVYEEKFSQYLPEIYHQGSVVIYQVP